MPGVLSLVELYYTLLLKGCLWSSIVYWIDTLPRGGMYKELPSPRTKRFGMYNISLYTIPCQRGCIYKKLLLEIAGCMVLNKTNTSLLMMRKYTLLYYIVRGLFVEIYFTVLLYCWRAVCGNILYNNNVIGLFVEIYITVLHC